MSRTDFTSKVRAGETVVAVFSAARAALAGKTPHQATSRTRKRDWRNRAVFMKNPRERDQDATTMRRLYHFGGGEVSRRWVKEEKEKAEKRIIQRSLAAPSWFKPRMEHGLNTDQRQRKKTPCLLIRV